MTIIDDCYCTSTSDDGSLESRYYSCSSVSADVSPMSRYFDCWLTDESLLLLCKCWRLTDAMAADRAEASEAALLHGELAHGPGATRARVLLQTTVAGHAGIRCTAGQRQNNNRLALLALVVISFVDDTGHNSATDTKNVSQCVITVESVRSLYSHRRHFLDTFSSQPIHRIVGDWEHSSTHCYDHF